MSEIETLRRLLPHVFGGGACVVSSMILAYLLPWGWWALVLLIWVPLAASAYLLGVGTAYYRGRIDAYEEIAAQRAEAQPWETRRWL